MSGLLGNSVTRFIGGAGAGGGAEDIIAKKSAEFDAEVAEGRHARRVFCGCLFVLLYLCLLVGGAVVIYMAIADVIHAYNNPVRSVKYTLVDRYSAPAIVVYPNGNTFLACGHYYNNIVGSKMRTSELDLTTKTCVFDEVSYLDPIDNHTVRQAVVFKGPTDINNYESLFMHFNGEDSTKDFFTVSYYVLPRWEVYNQSSHSAVLSWSHGKVPTYALSAEMRMWVKLSMVEVYFVEEPEPNMQFKVEMSVVQYLGPTRGKSHPFFIFFEWKNNLVEQSFQLYAITPWNLIASMCGLVLALYKSTVFLFDLRKRLMKVKEDAKHVRLPGRPKKSCEASSPDTDADIPLTGAKNGVDMQENGQVTNNDL